MATLFATIPVISISGQTEGPQPQAGGFSTTDLYGRTIDVTFSTTAFVPGDAITADIAESANFSIPVGTISGNVYQVTTGNSNITATLPAATSMPDGWYCFIRKVDTGTGIVLTTPITSPAATSVATQGHMTMFWTDAVNWYGRAWFGGVDSSGNTAITSSGTLTFTGTTVALVGPVTSTGSITTSVIGTTLAIKSGANSKAGTVTVAAGAATVANTSITANSIIKLTLKTVGGTKVADPYVATITPGTGFTLAGGGASDTSTYNYVVFEVN